MKALLDYDPLSGVSCWWHSDGQSCRLTHEQDLSFMIENNRECANDEDKTRRGWKNDWWHYARIPPVVEMIWLDQYGVDINNPDHKGKMFDLLNHPDWKYLKLTNKLHVVRS